MTEQEQDTQNIQLKDNDGEVADLKVSAQTAEKIIVQQSPSYQDRLFEKVADQALSNLSSVALGVFLTCAATVAIAHWLQIPEALKSFINNQKNLADGVSKLAETVGDLAETQKNTNQRIEKIEDAMQEVKFEVKTLKEKNH